MLITAKMTKGKRKGVRVSCKCYEKKEFFAWNEAYGLHANILLAVRKFCHHNYIAGNFAQWRENNVNYYIQVSANNTLEIGPHIGIP